MEALSTRARLRSSNECRRWRTVGPAHRSLLGRRTWPLRASLLFLGARRTEPGRRPSSEKECTLSPLVNVRSCAILDWGSDHRVLNSFGLQTRGEWIKAALRLGIFDSRHEFLSLLYLYILCTSSCSVPLHIVCGCFPNVVQKYHVLYILQSWLQTGIMIVCYI